MATESSKMEAFGERLIRLSAGLTHLQPEAAAELSALQERVPELLEARARFEKKQRETTDEAMRYMGAVSDAVAVVQHISPEWAREQASKIRLQRINPLKCAPGPVELWTVIMGYLRKDQSALHALTLTSSVMKDIATPILYYAPRFSHFKGLLSFFNKGNARSKKSFTTVINVSDIQPEASVGEPISPRRFMNHLLPLRNLTHLRFEGDDDFLKDKGPSIADVLASDRFDQLRRRLRVLSCPPCDEATALVEAIAMDALLGECRLEKLVIEDYMDELALLELLKLIRDGKLPDLKTLGLAGDQFDLGEPAFFESLDILAELSLADRLRIEWIGHFEFSMDDIDNADNCRWEEAFPEQFYGNTDTDLIDTTTDEYDDSDAVESDGPDSGDGWVTDSSSGVDEDDEEGAGGNGASGP